MRRPAVVILLLGLLTACGGGAEPRSAEEAASTPSASSTPTSAATAPGTATPTRSPAPGTRLVPGSSHVGTILFDDTGQAVYVFDVETTSKPRCYGECAEAWPPVLAEGRPRAGNGVEAALLGTTVRRDGARQVTYDGHPLYFYAHEGKHEVECHDVFLNGGTWYAIQPDGRIPA